MLALCELVCCNKWQLNCLDYIKVNVTAYVRTYVRTYVHTYNCTYKSVWLTSYNVTMWECTWVLTHTFSCMVMDTDVYPSAVNSHQSTTLLAKPIHLPRFPSTIIIYRYCWILLNLLIHLINPRHAWAVQGITVVCLFVCLQVTSAQALWVAKTPKFQRI